MFRIDIDYMERYEVYYIWVVDLNKKTVVDQRQARKQEDAEATAVELQQKYGGEIQRETIQ